MLDGLNGVIWRDDSQVADVRSIRLSGDPGVIVEVWRVERAVDRARDGGIFMGWMSLPPAVEVRDPEPPVQTFGRGIEEAGLVAERVEGSSDDA